MPNCRIENKDSKDYSMDGKVSGSSSSIKIPKGTTTISWNGSGDFVLGSGAACTFLEGHLQEAAARKRSLKRCQKCKVDGCNG